MRPNLISLCDDSHFCTDLADMPFGAFERRILRAYAYEAFRPQPGSSKKKVSEELMSWYRENQRSLRLAIDPMDEVLLHHRDGDLPAWAVLRYTSRTLPMYERGAPAPSALQKRVNWIAEVLHLGHDEARLLGAVTRLTQLPQFAALADAVAANCRSEGEVKGQMAAALAGLKAREGRRLTNTRSSLFQIGLLEDRGGGDVGVSATVLSVLTQRGSSASRLKSVLLGPSLPSTLGSEDFEHLGVARDQAVAVLKGALASAEPGAGILFYGPPGTGKTEFARHLTDVLKCQIVFIGETSVDPHSRRRDEPSRADRLSHLAFASALAARAGRVVLVIDEADDVFTGVDDEEFSNRSGSKVFMNRLVETCPAPTIWITNHPDRLGASVLRRMLLAVEFRQADRQTRLRIVRRHAETQGLALEPSEFEKLAALPAAPAILQSGLRAARVARVKPGQAGAAALAASTSILRAMGERPVTEALCGPIAFDAALSNADSDLLEIEARVAAAGAVPLSFLFSGLPGTGKSAFARHLAARLGMEVLEKRGSDLLGMYVGETEKRIANAFAEAADTRRFLIFDEADSLLSDRTGVRQTWEVGQVNEMLTWMERHPLPFAVTTNLASRLDPATQRRFLFKATFKAMTPLQAREAFRRAFGQEAPALVSRLDPLTPGDFSLVARKAEVLGISDASHLATMLEAEVAAKPGGGTRIGF